MGRDECHVERARKYVQLTTAEVTVGANGKVTDVYLG